MLVPEAITLVVPNIGTNAGGLNDGDIFQINDGQNSTVVFEFNSDIATLPGTVQVPLPTDPTPTGDEELAAFLNQIAMDIQTAIQGEIDAGRLNADVRVIDNQVVAYENTSPLTSGAIEADLLAIPFDGTHTYRIAAWDKALNCALSQEKMLGSAVPLWQTY